MNNRYRVIFNGQLQQGSISTEAKQKMQRLLGADSAGLLEQVNSGNPLVMKAGLQREDAEALARLLSRHGLPCEALAPGQKAGRTRLMYTGKLAPGPLPEVKQEKLASLLGPARNSVLAHIYERKPLLITDELNTAQAILLARLLTHNGLPCEVYAGVDGLVWKPVPPQEMTHVPAYAPRPASTGASLSEWLSPLFLVLVPLGVLVFVFYGVAAGSSFGLVLAGLSLSIFVLLRLLGGGASGFLAGVLGITALFACMSCGDDDSDSGIFSSDDSAGDIFGGWQTGPASPASRKPDSFVHLYQLIFTGRTPGYVPAPGDQEKLRFLLSPMAYDLEAALSGTELFSLKDGLSAATVYSLRQSLEKLGVNCEMLPKD